MTAWQIYLVMQFDSIGTFVTAMTFVSGGVAMILGGWFLACVTANPDDWYSPQLKAQSERKRNMAPTAWRLALKALVATLGLGVFAALLPSTQTAAAMVVIPAIANNETIHKEVADLYAIAKHGLRELVKPDDPEPKK